MDEIAALLDKHPDPAGAPPPDLQGRAKQPSRRQPVSRGRRDGFDQMMSASEIDAFKAQIAQCWNPPVGGLGAADLAVKLRIQLRKDGTLKQPPRLVNRQSSPFFQAAADSAIRAVLQCQPYSMPQAKYAVWKDMILRFDPRDMLAGN